MSIAAAVSESDGTHALLVLAGLYATWKVIEYFFGRIIGGNRAKHGGPGGGEKAIVGVLWLTAAVVVGILVASR